MVEFDSIKVKDQLGRPEDKGITVKRKTENVRVIGLPLRVQSKTLGHAWIAGSSTNGIVGTNTGTYDGLQQVVGGAGRVTTLKKVVSPFNTFREYFFNTTFKDTTKNNTANWDTTSRKLAMSTSNNHSRFYNTVMHFSELHLNKEDIYSVLLTSTETKWNPNDQIRYFLSADAGTNFQEATSNTELAFTYRGQDLRMYILFLGNGGLDTYISKLKIKIRLQ